VEKKLRTADLPTPRTAEGVIALVKRVIGLSSVMEIRITPSGVSVTRSMDSDDPVVPEPGEINDDVDFEFLLGRVELIEQRFDPESHPYLSLEAATRRLTGEGLRVAAILAPEPEILAAYLGYDEGVEPRTVFGIRVVYSTESKYPDKIVVIGGPTLFLSDATHGIILDIGA